MKRQSFPLFIIISLVIIVGFVSIIFRQKESDKKLVENSDRYAKTIEEYSKESKCTGRLTPEQTEGPYFKEGSPRTNYISSGIVGDDLLLIGYVYDENCKPLPNAMLDFWQADSKGEYDMKGYALRGHQFTDDNGMYRLETIIPAAYENRPPHIHVKVTPDNGATLTAQLYFPNDPKNETDDIFDKNLLVETKQTDNGMAAFYNFVVKSR